MSGWDISVGPDGIGLPPGSGTALKGAAVYEQKCQACHAVKGGGQPNDRLVGGQGSLAGKAPVRTIGSYWPYATTVFDYVRRAMPYTQPQSLTDDEVYAVTAYLLNLNGIIGERDEMNAQTLPGVKMPNRDNFIVVYPARRGKRSHTRSNVPRGWPSMLRPSMRISRVGPSRQGEWMSPSL